MTITWFYKLINLDNYNKLTERARAAIYAATARLHFAAGAAINRPRDSDNSARSSRLMIWVESITTTDGDESFLTFILPVWFCCSEGSR